MRKVFAILAATMLLVALTGSAVAGQPGSGIPNQGDPDKVHCFTATGEVDCEVAARICTPVTKKFEARGEQKSLWVPSKYDAVSIKSGAKACDFKGQTCTVTPKCGGFCVHLLQAISNYVFWECPPPPCNGG
jgi:hypothetical protein